MPRKLTESEKAEIYSHAKEIFEKGRVRLSILPIQVRHHFRMAGWEEVAIRIAVALIVELIKQWLQSNSRVEMKMPKGIWDNVEVQ